MTSGGICLHVATVKELKMQQEGMNPDIYLFIWVHLFHAIEPKHLVPWWAPDILVPVTRTGIC